MSRVLYLHGYGESSMIFSMAGRSLSAALEAAGATLLPVPDGFCKLKPDQMGAIADVEYRAQCEAGTLDAFGWYPLKRRADNTGCIAEPSQQEAALTKLCALIESSGGVDAIVGFSQGGELAHALAEGIERLSKESQAKLCLIATYGSEDTFKQRGKGLTPFPVAVSLRVRFLLSHGDGDAAAVHDTPPLATRLRTAGSGHVTTHVTPSLGHGLPQQTDQFAPLIEAMQAAVAERDADAAKSKQEPKEAPPPAPPAPMPPMPPKPLGWGTVRQRGPDEPWSDLVPRETILQCVSDFASGDDAKGAAATATLQGALSNNSIASDLYSAPGVVDILKAAAAKPKSSRDAEKVADFASLCLRRFGFGEYGWHPPTSAPPPAA